MEAGTAAAPLRRGPFALLAALPLVLLAAALLLFTATDTKLFGLIGENPPPPDELSVSRVDFAPGEIKLRVTNPQPEPITIAIATVDDAVANFSVAGSPTLERFDRRTVTIPFGWIEGQPYTIGLTSSTGVQTDAEVAAAVPAIERGAGQLLGLGLIGLLVGLLPVALGLMWLPGLRQLSDVWLTGFMAMTAGLLSFLAVDAFAEALEFQAKLPGSFGGLGLVMVGLTLSFFGVNAVSTWLKRRAQARADGTGGASRLGVGGALATAIALGIGLHNLGEGLAIGASFAVGELALSSLLIVGFAVHNITEGLAIAAPIADDPKARPSYGRLAALAALAGLPAVAGAWIGGLLTSNVLAVFFFALAAGAAAQVVVEVAGFIRDRSRLDWRSPAVAGGFCAGVAVMYLTSLIAG